MKRLIIALFAAGMLIGTMTACHTVRGAGQDVESLGQGMQNVAQ